MKLFPIVLKTRWIKVLKDIGGNKKRSMLVILSIAVGVAAVGMINTAKQIIQRDLYGSFLSGNPASLYVYTSPFQKDLSEAVQNMREVETAEARRTVAAEILAPKDQWEDIQLTVLPNYNNLKIDRFTLEKGSAIPGGREILLERDTANAMGINVGDEISIKMPDGRTYSLKVAGIVHDVYVLPFSLLGEATGFVRMETLQWMGEQPYYNQISLVVAENKNDRDHVLKVGETVRDRVIKSAGYQTYRLQIPGISSDPGEHWAHNQINGFLLILQIMGGMAIILSGGLIINTVSAIVTQQIRQIGVLRAMGGVRSQLVGMYFVNVLLLSILALLIALPLGQLGAYGIGRLAADFLNFDLVLFIIPLNVLLLQAGLGLFMPLLAALYPILEGTRMSVYEAVYQQGIQAEEKEKPIDRLLYNLRHISPPVLLSLRNTFRKKARLIFTLVTLTLAGAMFISVFSTRTSLTEQINQISRYVAFDASLGLNGGVQRPTAIREAMRIPGVSVAEGWASGSGVIIHYDGSESKALELVGLPYNAQTIDPLLLKGRWLRSGDSQTVVINEDLLETEKGLSIGDPIELKTGETRRTFTIVGITSKHLSGPRIYMTLEDFGRFTGRQSQVDSIRVRISPETVASAEAQSQVSLQLEKHFDNAGLSKQKATTQHVIFANFSQPFNIILIVLVIMASILSVVGGLGLTGVMGLNILERTREIGVLRAIGATNTSVVKVVVVEGIVVGLISWVLGAIVSVPSGWVLAWAVVETVLQAQVNYRYSGWGLLIWLVLILLIGIFSSLAPARDAARLTVREVLEYE
ncbi:MAG: FtsX-like permease family protein [Anaerolineaceae bacterium]|nr:FtsX-like permease family protein [Anaerolineaceae bacterium]